MARAYQKEESKEVIKERRAQQRKRYLESLKFGFYCMTHPIDGFWKLTHEKKGTIGAATTILIVTILVRILKLRYTSFLFLQVYWEDINV